MSFNISLSTINPSLLPFTTEPVISSPKFTPTLFKSLKTTNTFLNTSHKSKISCGNVATAQVEVEEAEVEIAEGYTMTKFCDKVIDVFLKEKPKPKEWKSYLIYREDWSKYKDHFYNRCKARADGENDPNLKQDLIALARKVKRVDDEMERHGELLKEIQDSPTDINAIVAKRRKDFTGEFFQYLTLVQETFGSMEDRDGMDRLGARCLSSVSSYDKTLETVETLDTAQAKFDDILNSPSLEAACAKIKALAKEKRLDSSLILLINSAWASAKDSPTMKNEVKEIMYQLYKTTKSSLRSIAPKELKLLKYLLNIIDPEERFSALATAFSPGEEHEAKDPSSIYTTPKELHKWIKIVLDTYQLHTEESDIKEAKEMNIPMVIHRLFILKDTIEQEYLERQTPETDKGTNKMDQSRDPFNPFYGEENGNVESPNGEEEEDNMV